MSEPQQTVYSSSLLIRQALAQEHYQCIEFELPRRMLHFTSPSGWDWLTPAGRLAYPFVPHAVRMVSDNKYYATEFARQQGINAPATLLLPRDTAELKEFLVKYAPIVVKPLDGSASQGVSLHITEEKSLKKAIRSARQFSDKIIVQQQCYGAEVRLTVIGGRVVSALLREPASVVGDGVSTLTQLIDGENEQRRKLKSKYLKYPQLDDKLIPRKLLVSKRVPAKGERVTLNDSAMVGKGASIYEIVDSIHPDYIAIAERMAAALNPAFLVIDLMINDYTQPQAPENYHFIECNVGPSLLLYSADRKNKTYDIVAAIVAMIDEMGRNI